MNMNPFNILASGAAAKPGQVFLANEGAVDNQFLSEALTQYSVGWKSPDGKLEATLKALTGEPIVVPKRFSFKKMVNAKAFAAVENDEDVRAIGADFKRVTVEGETVDQHTVSKGLTLRLDRDELNDNPQAEQDAVAYLRTLLMRGEIIRAFAGLSGAATGGNAIAATWTAASKTDADAAILAALPGFVGGMTKWQDLERLDLAAVVESVLAAAGRSRRELDRLAPARMEVPSGSKVAIDYEGDEPTASVKLQECFGLMSTPTVAGGRVPVVMTLLSPAMRPIQVTKDLAGFWTGAYQLVRKDMRGRYPKHNWPEDPLSAVASRRTLKR